MNKKSLFLTISLAASLGISSVRAGEGDLAWPVVNKEAKPFTRWWWLGSAVDKPNLTYNLETLQKVGIGGVEVTPIYGVKGNEKNELQFLSPAWMDMLKHTITESNRLGMEVDMNTGTGWPFGGPQITSKEAAGKVFFQTYTLAMGQRLTEPVLIAEAKQKKVASLNCLMAYSNKGEKLNLTSKVKPDGSLDWTAPEGNWKLIAQFNGKTLQAVKRAAPGGEGLVMDHFSKEASDVYFKRFTQAFTESGSPKPSTFFNDSYEVFAADWTPTFLDEFAKRRGYKLEDYFPELSGEGNPDVVARVKSDYRETMSNILIENFTQTWTNWAHSLGSINRNQGHGSPANLMDVYTTPDIPECETFGTTPFNIPGLRRNPADVRQGDADPLMIKFASSAAHITGKKWASSETFTWVGEHFKVALSQCKPELDQLLLSGINHVVFHGCTYSPKEAAWPGWLFYASVDFVPGNGIWKDLPGLTSYIARCQSFLQSGKPDNDIVMYWPVYDLWNNAKGLEMQFRIHDTREWLSPSNFYKTGSWMRKNGFDFDYVSDKFLANATVVDGKVMLPGGGYKTLIIPRCAYMPVETLDKVLALAKQGANIIFIESLPGDVNGLSNLASKRQQFAKLKATVPAKAEGGEPASLKLEKGEVFVGDLSVKLLEKLNIKPESIVETGVGYIRRKDADGNIYFFANQQAKPLSAWVKLAVDAKSAAIFDPITGTSGVAQIRTKEGATEVYLQLEPDQSIILKTYTNKEIAGQTFDNFEAAGSPVALKGAWKLNLTDGVPETRQEFKLDTLTSWTNLGNASLKVFAGTGKYTLTFTLPAVSADNWKLDLGRVCESARVKINGVDAGIWWSVPYSANIGKYLKKGENILEIEVTNLSANRLAELDRQGVQWKIFRDANILDVNYQPFDASKWKIMDSGLIGPVTLTPLKKLNQ
jgi:hypothetical protein